MRVFLRVEKAKNHFLTSFTNFVKGITQRRSNADLSKVKKLPIIHHNGYVCNLPPNHRFPMKKFNIVMDILLKDNVVSENQVVKPTAVSQKDASLVHTKEYVKKFFEGMTSEDEQRVTGFEWSKDLVSRVRLETGGTLQASLIALERGMAASTGGGTHHAFSNYGSGFCLINDLAVSSQYLISNNIVKKVLVVDLDVHQGDGTASIFRDNKNVFTFSMHCQKNFPFRKQKSDLDVPLDTEVEDSLYMKYLSKHLPTLLDLFRPDIVLYDAGVDPHYKDELGKLNLTDNGLFLRDYYVFSECACRGISVASVIGGGYSSDLQELSSRHTIVHRAAVKAWNKYLTTKI